MELILEYQNVISFLAIFIVIALASRQIGQFFARLNLPLITGFLFTGLITGPFILGLLPAEAVERLRFLDELSLGFIAFAAGSELYVEELRSRFKSIIWVTIGNAVVVPVVGSLAIFLMADYIPFMQDMPVPARIAVSILGGAILVARSPSSAIAIVDELRAKGPFTKTVLGVTMITDLVVIILFAVSSSVADALLTNLGFDGSFILLLLGEFTLSLIIGYSLGKTLQIILAMPLSNPLKIIGILIAGFGVFPLTALIRGYTHDQLPFEIFLEPLLICMIGSFFVTNFTKHRNEFLKLLQDAGPPIYIIFFTLTGDALALDILMKTLVFALILFGVRVAAIFIGSLAGGVFAGDPVKHSQVSWMAYITQAGVGLGLAKEVGVEFSEWGSAFATMIISVIVVSQIVGPPFFKWAINLVKEAHPRAMPSEFDGVRDAIIFGLESQSLALARHLQAHGWQVKIACAEVDYMAELATSDVAIHPAPELTLATMHQLEMDRADAIVTLLSDEESYRICELAYEHFGTKNLVVRLHNWANFDRFQKLGALIVEPGTAIVSLLDQFVRSPSAASLLLGMDAQEMVDIEVRNPDLHGLHLRDLRLPEDVLLLSVRRNGAVLVSHGYTRLERGDQVTVFGSSESLAKVMFRFDN